MIVGVIGAAVGAGHEALRSAILARNTRVDVPFLIFDRLTARVSGRQFLLARASQVQESAAAFVAFGGAVVFVDVLESGLNLGRHAARRQRADEDRPLVPSEQATAAVPLVLAVSEVVRRRREEEAYPVDDLEDLY